MNKLLFLLFFPLALLAQQPDTSGQHRLIRGLVDYRNELIARNPEGFKKLYLLDTLWKVEDKEEVVDMLTYIPTIYKSYGISADELAMLTKRLSKDYEYKFLLTPEILKTIIDNDDMSMLIGESILKQKPPFAINPENSFYQELGFYKIENGMRIAEIGAGDGLFSLLIGIAYDSLNVCFNDIDLDLLNVAFNRIKNCKSIGRNNKYFIALGYNNSTQLEEYQFDKIIIRNSFHHFSHKKKMLASIRKSLPPDGDLFIMDPLKIESKRGVCPFALPINELRAILIKNGFQIIEERKIHPWDFVMLQCKPI